MLNFKELKKLWLPSSCSIKVQPVDRNFYPPQSSTSLTLSASLCCTTSFVPLPFSARFLRWIQLSRNRYVRTRVNIIEAMYERSGVSVKVEPRSTFTFTSYTLYIASFIYAGKIYVRAQVKITWQWISTFSPFPHNGEPLHRLFATRHS